MHPRKLIKLADASRLTRWPDGAPRVPVLLYHRMARSGEQIDPAAAVSQTRFDRQLGYLADAGYMCISLDRLIGYVRNGQPVPNRSFVITFDDGFLDTYRLAWPVLRRRGMPATVFLVSDRIGKTSEWMQTEPSGPQLLMGADHIRRMHAGGVDFGSHGCAHWDMTALNETALSDELVRSRARLSELLGHEVRTLAYPYGRFETRERLFAARAGYTAAASVVAGWNHPGTDPLALRRIVVSGRDTGMSLLVKMVLGEHMVRWHRLSARMARAAWAGAANRLLPQTLHQA